MTRSFYVVATPLGNLGDISERTRATLAAADVIAAEDTRTARKLLSALGIAAKRIVSVREHNEASQAQALAAQELSSICYLADAGTPAISDPGARAVAIFRSAGWSIIPIAGPSAAAAAFSVAGMTAAGFVFLGFLPHQKQDAQVKLEQAAALSLPIVLYASPRTITSTVNMLARIAPDASLCICRELTKKHEQITAGNASELAGLLEQGTIPKRGEFTAVVTLPKPAVEADALKTAKLLREHLPASKAARLAARICNANARTLYAALSSSANEN